MNRKQIATQKESKSENSTDDCLCTNEASRFAPHAASWKKAWIQLLVVKGGGIGDSSPLIKIENRLKHFSMHQLFWRKKNQICCFRQISWPILFISFRSWGLPNPRKNPQKTKTFTKNLHDSHQHRRKYFPTQTGVSTPFFIEVLGNVWFITSCLDGENKIENAVESCTFWSASFCQRACRINALFFPPTEPEGERW